MAKIADIIHQELNREDPAQWNVIHLYETGSFYSAYEWSAWLISVITFNDAARMATKDRKPLAVIRTPLAEGEGSFCRVGFPLKSAEKFIPERLSFESVDNKHIAIAIALPQPTDGSVITYERLAKAFNEWKNAQPLKQPKEQKESAPSQPSSPKPEGGGIIAQIMSYQLASHSTSDNYAFIQHLQQIISSIL